MTRWLQVRGEAADAVGVCAGDGGAGDGGGHAAAGARGPGGRGLVRCLAPSLAHAGPASPGQCSDN